jgi:hypothetical protein
MFKKISLLEQEKEELKQEKEELKKTVRLLIPLIAQGHEQVYERFLKGKLIYKPDPKSDEGRVELLICELKNPLEGTFDLSKCGDTGKYLSINTGYRKGKKQENANKLEIWFVPRFLVKKELDTTAQHFKEIFPAKWPKTAPVGIFWTQGSWDYLDSYDYITTESMENLSINDLYVNWSMHAQIYEKHKPRRWW